MIAPTVGRIVWYYDSQFDVTKGMPKAAIICAVHGVDRVNLTVFGHTGIPSGRTNVILVQDGIPTPQGNFCIWMPYQLGQAKKTEEMQARAEELEDRLNRIDDEER